MIDRHVPRRISVVGSSGVGKTTFARCLAQKLNLRHIELDAIHWGSDWTPMPAPLFRQEVASSLGGDRWVVDGNYHLVRDLVWSRADTVIWLDFPLGTSMVRLLRRTRRRILSSERLWNGNRERLATQFSRDSLFLYALRTHRRRRKEFVEWLKRPEYLHLKVIRLASPRESRAWMLACGSSRGDAGHRTKGE